MVKQLPSAIHVNRGPVVPNLLTYMRVFLLRFVRVGASMARLTNMYDTSSESWAHGAVDRLLLISIAFIHCEY